MAEPARADVIRRKAEAGRAASAAMAPPSAGRALTEAIRRAGEEEFRTALLATEPKIAILSQAELLEKLPDLAFLGLLSGPSEGVGLAVLDAHALAAVIELRTTGRLSPRAPPPRRPTRTDAAMAADFVDRILSEFETPLLSTDEARWASGWRYQTLLPDPRPLPMLLEDAAHRLIEISLVLADGAREGRLLLVLPAKGRAEPRPPPLPLAESPEARRAAHWERAMGEALAHAEAQFDAVLGRLVLPLGDLARLEPGDRIALPLSALGAVRIVAPGGVALAEGRLGQSGGLRAIKLAEAAPPLPPLPAEGAVIAAGTLHMAGSAHLRPAPEEGGEPARLGLSGGE
jgi:flagellar motor switch protein FliM